MGKAVVPDLPYGRSVVPDGREALEQGGRFARLARSLRLRVRSASERETRGQSSRAVVRGPQTTGAARRRALVRGLGIAVSTAVALTFFASSVQADDLSDHRARVKHQLAQTRNELSESTHALTRAGIAVDKAQGKLDLARQQLAQTRKELRVAKAKDVAMAAKLKKARADLAAAKAAVAAGQAKLDAQRATAGQMVRDQYQQQNNLLPLAALIGSQSTEELQTRLQWSTTMFDTAQATIDRLTVIQRQLNAARARQAELEVQMAADRREAAANLKVKEALKVRAATQEARVARLLAQRRHAQQAAARDVAKDKARYAKLNHERALVEHRIAVRIAKARAAAARRAQKARNSSRGSSGPTRRSAHRKPARPGPSYVGRGFSYPVSAPITSPYGLRFHPVLHYWKLHDGTDFGAGCGTAIRAPHSGRVAERYYNAGYGNRLMIDHGNIDGSYVTTGFSTGCHLHLMVWLNGHVVNPMRWF